MYERYRDRGFEVVAFPANDFWQQEPGTNQVHGRTRQTYGPEQLQAELRSEGFPAGIGRIKRLCKKLRLRCTQVRRFTPTTASNHSLPVTENILAQTVVGTGPNETWVTDITYVPTAKDWLYLAGIKDLFTCEVVGPAMGGRMTTDSVIQALGIAVWVKRPRPGLSRSAAAVRHDRVHASEGQLL
jgi:transposase InsO family protein